MKPSKFRFLIPIGFLLIVSMFIYGLIDAATYHTPGHTRAIPPFTIVCDGQGHFGYTWKYSDGDTGMPTGYYDSRAEAEQVMNSVLKLKQDEDKNGDLQYARIKEVQAMPWQVCKDPAQETAAH